MAVNPCDELYVDLSRTDIDVAISTEPCIDVDIIETDIVLSIATVANQGPKGDPGEAGATGATGPSGPPGSPGLAASVTVGTTTTGAPGTSASVTDSDPSGNATLNFVIPRGDVGPVGPGGQGIEIKGTVANHAALPATGNTPGDVWVTLDTGHGWSWNGTTWIDIGPLQGPPGATGPQGPSGPTGSAGAAATVAAGTTTTGSPGTAANVTNTGTSSAAIFAFTIPRGDVGATGAAGTPGGAGSPGAAGLNAWTLVTSSSFTVPAYGSSVVINTGDTSWVALGEWVYIDDAAGVGTAGQMTVTAKTPTTLTLFNPTPAAVSGAGTKTYSIFQAAFQSSPPATLYAVFGVQNNRPHLAYNDSATWGAYFSGVIPQGAVLSSGLIVRLKWKSITVATGNCRWSVSFERLNTAESADSFDTAVAATTAVSGTTSVLVETAITVTTIDGLTAGDGFVLLVQRLGADAADTLVGDACLRLVSVESAA